MRPNPKSKSEELPAGYSPRPAITITLQPGQEIRIIAADSKGNVPGLGRGGAGPFFSGGRPDENSPSPPLKRDQR